MKILHCCLACFYVEGYAYQENVLPRVHSKLGCNVRILASTETYVGNSKLGYIKPCTYVNKDGIEVTRIPYKRLIPQKIAPKARVYEGFYKYIEQFKPDFIFLHDVQFYNVLDLVKYKKQHPEVTIVADGHTDYRNSARGFLSRKILHGCYYKMLVHKSEKVISKFYGTLPSRCGFFEEMYGIPHEKIEYLPMGIDDEKLRQVSSNIDRESFRRELCIGQDEVLIISGGKINKNKKGIINLVKAVSESKLNVKLVVFGSLDDDMKIEYEKVVDTEKVSFVGWLNEEESIKYMLASDVAAFPSLHSTLWEQAAGIGLPCILYKMENFTHININNNCVFIDNTDYDSILEAINYTLRNIDWLSENAKKAKPYFSYYSIGEMVIRDNH